MRARHALGPIRASLALLAFALAPAARAEIVGVAGSSFDLTARADRITTPDGNSILFWGFAVSGTGRPQYPGPTLIVDQGALVTISVTNALPASAAQRVSITFPGQEGIASECAAQPCTKGPLGLEAGPSDGVNPGGKVTYRFTAARAGTFHYTSGSQPDLQIEMGLVGALIVRPPQPRQAYQTPASAYDREFLFLLSEMDSHIHDIVERQGPDAVYRTTRLSNYFPNYWFINGRNAPDSMAEDGGGRFPTQPYGSLVRVHPGDRVLMRVIGGGHDLHPFHHHGNHARVIAVDGHLLETGLAPGSLDLSHEVFTIQSVPGQTVDALFSWTGKELGWDIYGDAATHAQVFPGVAPPSCDATAPRDAEGLDTRTREYCADHGKPLPVALPDLLSTDFGGFWSGSPYLGVLSLLPPGQGGLNPDAGYTYMWHSHTEKEITNFDIFPGGMMTMLVVVPVSVILP